MSQRLLENTKEKRKHVHENQNLGHLGVQKDYATKQLNLMEMSCQSSKFRVILKINGLKHDKFKATTQNPQ